MRQRLLNSILEKLWAAPAAPRPAINVPAGNTAIFARAAVDPQAGGRFVNAAQTLDVLRDFSPILTHSLNAEAMLKQFLQFLRDILSVNRAAIFLEPSVLAAHRSHVARRQPAVARGVGHRPRERSAGTF